MRTLTLLLVLVAGAPTVNEAWGQRDSLIKVGARVRIDKPNARIVGRVAEIRGDTLVVDRGQADSLVPVPLSDVTELAVYERTRTAQKLAMAFGTVGALTGAALYLNWCLKDPEWCRSVEPEDPDPYDDEIPTSFFATVTIGFGAIGMLLGHAFAPPQWQIIDPSIRVGLTPTSTGIAAYFSMPAPRFVRR